MDKGGTKRTRHDSTMPTIGPDLEKRLAAFFDVYDIDGNGDIDISEFNKIEVRLEVQSSEASKMWGLGGMDADADPAGTIFYDQFRTIEGLAFHL